jgi:hypothetical protein
MDTVPDWFENSTSPDGSKRKRPVKHAPPLFEGPGVIVALLVAGSYRKKVVGPR